MQLCTLICAVRTTVNTTRPIVKVRCRYQNTREKKSSNEEQNEDVLDQDHV